MVAARLQSNVHGRAFRIADTVFESVSFSMFLTVSFMPAFSYYLPVFDYDGAYHGIG